MRLWHIDLIRELPRQQLLGQWREVHGSINHATVHYVNNHSLDYLYAYGLLVADEMQRRGYKVNPELVSVLLTSAAVALYNDYMDAQLPIYSEHDGAYMLECLENLKRKGIEL